ncbi:MAG: IpaD/SipD/SspD family type III secretion system needle tip protein, partial [Burkholderiales bacterium]|nr:IpaD/SipD/SspD family type III secretion system needle tip protein [Burkholderiales bacterium]
MTIALSSTPLQHLISVPQHAASAEKAAPQAIEQSEVKAAPRSQLQALHQQLQALTEQGKSLHQQLKTLSRDALQGKPLTPRAAQQLEDTKAERQLSLHSLQSLMPNSLPPLAYERVQLALEEFTANAWPGFDNDPSSSWGINDSIGNAIGDINDGYLGVYENAVDAYIAFYGAFSDILALLADLISGASDGQTVTVDVAKLKELLQGLKNKFFPGGFPGENSVLFPPQDGDGEVKGGTKADAEKWAKEMGLDPSCVKQNRDGSYVVTIDIG